MWLSHMMARRDLTWELKQLRVKWHSSNFIDWKRCKVIDEDYRKPAFSCSAHPLTSAIQGVVWRHPSMSNFCWWIRSIPESSASNNSLWIGVSFHASWSHGPSCWNMFSTTSATLRRDAPLHWLKKFRQCCGPRNKSASIKLGNNRSCSPQTIRNLELVAHIPCGYFCHISVSTQQRRPEEVHLVSHPSLPP